MRKRDPEQKKADIVTIQVGDKNYSIEPDHLPPVGTKITAHKHLYDGGTYPVLEVVAHEWRLEEAPAENGGPENRLPVFSITIKTRMIDK
jgi:hypothetical protein